MEHFVMVKWSQHPGFLPNYHGKNQVQRVKKQARRIAMWKT